MAINDTISDTLTRIRNAGMAGHDTTNIPYSKMSESIARILMREGFVHDVQVVGEGVRKQITVAMKYAGPKRPVFTAIERTSKPGRRIYVSHKNIRPTRQGVGIAILTTPKGVMTDNDAKRQGVGGEIICTVW
jgi:small subunit ribosomal protein S8